MPVFLLTWFSRCAPANCFGCYLISDSEDITIGRVAGSVGVERLVDLVIATASLAVVFVDGGFTAEISARGRYARRL